jgi:3-oxoacyl-[acyl-carrier-protein] synthase-1
MNKSLDIIQCGAITPVGLTARQTCAAIKAKISAFQDAYYLPPPEEPIVGACIPASRLLKSSAAQWLINLSVRAIEECFQNQRQIDLKRTALIVNFPEEWRNHPAFNETTPKYLLQQIESTLGRKFILSECIQDGHAGAFKALELSREILQSGKAESCCIGGVDSMLNGEDIARLRKSYRLREPNNSWGLVPGEGAAFVLLGIAGRSEMPLGQIKGIGISVENDNILGARFSQGRALQKALRLATKDAILKESKIDFRISDANGERYRALESLMAETRFYRTRREHFPCWNFAASVGDIMSAAGFLAILVASIALSKGYAPGLVAMCEGSSDAGLRGACLVQKPPNTNRS